MPTLIKPEAEASLATLILTGGIRYHIPLRLIGR